MNEKDTLELRLKELGEAFANEEPLAVGVMARVAERSPHTTRPRVGLRLLRPALALATALVIGVAFWLTLFGGPSGLYGQVLAALDKTHSIHVVGERLQDDGTWAKGIEIWYDRDRGYAAHEYRNGRRHIHVDDGTHLWKHTAGTTSVMELDSAGPNEEILELLNVEKLRRQAVRNPAEDRIVDGISCVCYLFEYEGASTREVMWLGDDSLIHRWEERKRNESGGYCTYGVITMAYDVPIEPELFAIASTPGTEVFKAGDVLRQRFDLDRAVYKREVMGLTLAVHELRPLDDGRLYVVCSLRPSDETVRQFGPLVSEKGAGSAQYGDFSLCSWWERLPGGDIVEHPYHILSLMRMYNDGLRAEWFVFEPGGTWEGQDQELELCVNIHTRRELQEERKKQGLPWHDRFMPLDRVPLPKERISLHEAARMAHRDGCELEPVANQLFVILGRRQVSEKEMQWYRENDPVAARTIHETIAESPSSVTAIEVAEAFEARMAEHKRRARELAKQ